jgi:hypothetical protein
MPPKPPKAPKPPKLPKSSSSSGNCHPSRFNLNMDLPRNIGLKNAPFVRKCTPKSRCRLIFMIGIRLNNVPSARRWNRKIYFDGISGSVIFLLIRNL